MRACQQPGANNFGVQNDISADHHLQIQSVARYSAPLPKRALPPCHCNPRTSSKNSAAATERTARANSLHQDATIHTDHLQTSLQPSHNPAQAAIALTRQIKQSKDWRQLVHIWRQWNTYVNAVHLAALLVQAVKTAPQAGSLKDAVEFTRLDQCRAREAASIAWAAAKLGAVCSELHSQTANLSSRPQPGQQPPLYASSMQYTGYIEQTSHQSTKTTLHGLSGARQDVTEGMLIVSAEWWATVMNRCMQLLTDFNGQDMSMMLWAVVAIQGQQEAQQQQLLSSYKGKPSFRTIPSQLPHDTSNSASIVATEQQQAVSKKKSYRQSLTAVVLPPDFLQKVVDVSETALSSYSAQALSGTVWALAKLRVLPSISWQEQFLAASCNQLQKAEPQGLANTSWALAVMEVEPTREWASAFLATSMRCAERMPPASASQLLWAAARIPSLQPSNKWVATMCTAIHPQLNLFSPQDMANTLWAVAHLGYKPPMTWMETAMPAVQAQLPAYQPLELSAVLMAVAKLQYHPGDAAVNSMVNQVLKRKPTAGLQSLVNCLWAVARLGFRPQPSWMQRALSNIGRQLHDIGPQDLAMLWWSLAKLGCRPSQQMVSALSEDLMIQKAVMAPQEIAMLLTGYAKLGIYHEKEALDSLMSQLLRGMAAQPTAGSHNTHKLQMALPTDYNVPQTIVSVLQALARMAKNSRGQHGKSQAGLIWQLLTRCVVRTHPSTYNSTVVPDTSDNMPTVKHGGNSKEKNKDINKAHPPVPAPQLQPEWSALEIALVLQALSYLGQPLPRAWGAAGLLHVSNPSNAQQWREGRAAVIAACALARLHALHSARTRILSTAGRRTPWGKAAVWSGLETRRVTMKLARKTSVTNKHLDIETPNARWLDGWVVALSDHLGKYTADDWRRCNNSQLTQASGTLMYLVAYSCRHGKSMPGSPDQKLLAAYHSLIQHAFGRATAGLLDPVQSTQLLSSTARATRLATQHELHDIIQLQSFQTQLLSTPSFSHVTLETFGVRELCNALAVVGRARIPVDPLWLQAACHHLHRKLREQHVLPEGLQATSMDVQERTVGATAVNVLGAKPTSSFDWSAPAPVTTALLPRDYTATLVTNNNTGGSNRPLARHPAVLTANDCEAAVAGLRILLRSQMFVNQEQGDQDGAHPGRIGYAELQVVSIPTIVEQLIQDLERVACLLLEHRRQLRRQYLLRKLIR